MLEDIVEVFRNKGWNLFAIQENETLGAAVKRHPSTSMTPGAKYLVWPIMENHEDARAVLAGMIAYDSRPTVDLPTGKALLSTIVIEDTGAHLRIPTPAQEYAMNVNYFRRNVMHTLSTNRIGQ